MPGDSSGIGEILIGLFFTIAGVASLLIQEIPVICFGALIFGPILMISGFIKAARGGRRPAYRAAYPPAYYPGPPAVGSAPPGVGSAPPAAPAPSSGSPGSRTCANCGRTVPEIAQFCPGCGTPFPR